MNSHVQIPPLAIRTAQVLGLTASSLVAGAGLTINFIIVPVILRAPGPLLVQQWKHMYNLGKASVPLVAVAAGASYFYLFAQSSYTSYESLAAGIAVVGIIPWTLLTMLPTNNTLMEMEAKASSMSGEEKKVGVESFQNAHELVDKWGLLQLGRTALSVTSMVLGFYSVFY